MVQEVGLRDMIFALSRKLSMTVHEHGMVRSMSVGCNIGTSAMESEIRDFKADRSCCSLLAAGLFQLQTSACWLMQAVLQQIGAPPAE